MARIAPSLGRLQQGASGDERAQHYASVVQAYYEDRKGLLLELDETKGIALQAASNAERGLEGIGRIERRLSELFPKNRRVAPGQSIAPGEYFPDVTATGTYKVAPEAWDGMLRRFEEQDEAVQALQRQLELKDAEKRGAEQAAEASEKASERRQKKIATICTVLGALGALAAWALAHFKIL